jgi:hypothetical protein
MCPACMASATVVVAGLMSTGGLTALFLKLRAKAAQRIWSKTNLKEGTWAK